MFIKKALSFILALSIIFGLILFTATADSDSKTSLIKIRKGDVNLDGQIGASDARLALRVSAKLESDLDEVALWAADIDGDGKVTASDSRCILRMSAKMQPFEDVFYEYPEELECDTAPNVPTGPPQLDTSYATSLIPPTDIKYENFPLPDFPAYVKKEGTFAFTTFGYGHGVGMSQYGAIYLAKEGYNYKQILNHYYRGTEMLRGEVPETLLMPDFKTPVCTREILGRITQQEIAGVTYDKEALKAQVVAAYTYSLYNRNCVNGLAFSSSADKVRDDVWAAVDAVWGEYLVDSKNNIINALFFALSAGRTTLPSTVWQGSVDVPSLSMVDSPFDRTWSSYNKYIETKIFTVDEIRTLVEKFNEKVRAGKIKYCGEIVLQENPGEWFRILSHDEAVSKDVGYVTQMKIGNQTLDSCAGQRIRADLFGYSIRSHCLIIEYFGSQNSSPNVVG